MEDHNKDLQPNNVLHGVRLKDMLVYLEKNLGWEKMGEKINIKCFTTNPSMGSSLTFLRRTTWAKNAVQQLYADTINKIDRPISIAPPPKVKKINVKEAMKKDDDGMKSIGDLVKKYGGGKDKSS
jgi:uncharacterized protein (DUF2132 family)